MIELDRHIEILLLSNDCVIIPDFGGFMAHYADARRDEADGLFLPPLRTIGFNPKLTLNDSLLAQSYVEAYDISYPDAVTRIEDEVRELRQHLENDGCYELSDIGVLRLGERGSYEFEPCEAGLLTPGLYGLDSFELKSVPQLESELAAATALTELPVRTAQTADMVSTVETSEEEEPLEDGRRHALQIAIWRNMAVACIALLVFLLVPAPLSNNNTVLVQSKVDTGLLLRIMPKNVTTGEETVKEAVSQVPVAMGKQAVGPTVDSAATPYTIVLASRVTRRNAAAYVADLHRRGYDRAEMMVRTRGAKVVYGHYATRQEAYRQLYMLNKKSEFAEAWVMKN